MDSWTISFLREWAPRMSLASALRLRNYAIRERLGRLRPHHMLVLHMKRPFHAKIALREVGSDMATFQEIVKQEVYKPISCRLPGFQTLIDLGANIGLATLYLAQNSPGCQVLAVEPNPDTHRVLKHNLQSLSRAGRCRTLRGAVWGAHRLLSLVPEAGQDRFSMFTVSKVRRVPEADLKVEGYTMPELLEYAGFESVDLLKVDIEGAEVELFKNDMRWLERVGCLAIEFHEGTREASQFDEVMTCHGFQILPGGNHTVWAARSCWVERLGRR